MIDKLLEKYGLQYEHLNKLEQETLHSWLNAAQESQVSIEKIRSYIQTMKESVELELTQTGLDSKKDTYLKARLRNYMLLEQMLTSPEKAKRKLEAAISGLAGGIG